jgi:zinc resistance-associated protein
MKKHVTAKTIMVLITVLVMGTAGSALAYRGWGGHGRGDGECSEDGNGWKRGGEHRYGYGMENMSREDIEQMTQLRQAFFNDTKTLRSDLRSKALELQSELAKENPALETVKSLQKELSALEAQMDQKRIEHQLAMRKVNPDAGRGFEMGYGPRGGRGEKGGCWR